MPKKKAPIPTGDLVKKAKMTVTKTTPTEAEAAAQAVDAAITKSAKEQAQIEADNVTAAISLHKELCERFGFADNTNTFLTTSQMLAEGKTEALKAMMKEAADAGGFTIDEKSLPNVHLNREANTRLNAAVIDGILKLTERRVIEKRAEKRKAPA